MSYARTEHADRDAQGVYKDPIETVLFTDGLKRVLQTKKDASVAESAGVDPRDVMIASGRVAFDAFGRAIAQYYPSAAPKGAADTAFQLTPDGSADPTVTDYDVLDRALSTMLPDKTTTTMAYGFDSDAFGKPRFKTTVTDANGNTKQSLRDVRSLITTVIEENRAFGDNGLPLPGGKTPIVTKYVYDPLKEITQVIDAGGNKTDVEYDELGRRTAIDNPDTGKTVTVYDPASNPIQRITANLAAKQLAISYDYDHTRLIHIAHPLYPDADVTYTYGTSDDTAHNQAGRVKLVQHQSGSETREYGSMGEVTKETLTLSAAVNGGATPPEYTTQYDFDSFGRMMKITMPDKEEITNRYDSGGNVDHITGTLNGRPYAYLEQLTYDRFEQRLYLKDGNGVKTAYAYDPQNRRLTNLKSGSGTPGDLQDLNYSYDAVGNITDLVDTAPIPKANEFGGQSEQHFHYDDLYRLVKANGSYTTAQEVQAYDFAMAYDQIHNITHKYQQHTVTRGGGSPRIERATTYDWGYTYRDFNQPQPHAPTHIGNRTFSYDANGNQTGWENTDNGTRRVIVWDEENRIREVQDPKHGARFTYDDRGERKLKWSQYGETAYVNQFFTVRNGAIASTHVYAGNTRIVTKVNAGRPVGKAMHGTLSGTGNLATTSATGGSFVVGGSSGTASATGSSAFGSSATGASSSASSSGFPGQGLEHRSERANEVAQNTAKNPHYTGVVPGHSGDNGGGNSGGNGSSHAGGKGGGKPTQNAYIENFNGKFRDECLNDHYFNNLAHARALIAEWWRDYNETRPHSSLGRIPPAQFAAQHRSNSSDAAQTSTSINLATTDLTNQLLVPLKGAGQ